MLKPLFLSTRKVKVPLYRTSLGQYVKGRWVEGVEQQVPNFYANVQPATEQDTALLEESDRSREALKVYSSQEIRRQIEGVHGADEIEWEGQRYEVLKVRHYKMGILDHYKAIAVLKELINEPL